MEMGIFMSMRSTADVIVDHFGQLAPPTLPTGARDLFSVAPGAWDGRSIAINTQVQNALNLWLPLKSRAQFPALQALLEARRADFHAGVLGLRNIHFARFLPSSDFSQLMVITSFDGDIESYLMDFVGSMAGLFNDILQYIAGAPPLPVEEHPELFAEFVMQHHLPAKEISAYPQLTTLEVLRLSGIRGNTLYHQPSPGNHALPAPGTGGVG